MKKLNILLLMFLLTPMVFAKIEQFSTPMNISVFNNTFRIGTEDMQIRYYSPGTNVKEVVTAKIYRNTSCQEETLYDYLRTVTGIYNGSAVSTIELRNCKSEVSNLKTLAYMANTSLTYKDQFIATCTAAPVQTTQTQIDPINNPSCIAAINQARLTATPAQQQESGGSFIFPLLLGGIVGFFIGRGNFANTSTDGMNRVN